MKGMTNYVRIYSKRDVSEFVFHVHVLLLWIVLLNSSLPSVVFEVQDQEPAILKEKLEV